MDLTVFLPVTTLAAILNGALLVVMTAGVGMMRRKKQVSLGDGGDKTMLKRQRGHANGAEQIPIALILLALVELQGGGAGVLWAIAGFLTIGRFLHATRFWRDGAPFVLRPLGVVLTLIAQIIAIIWLIGVVV
jgi:uncharacterized protein